MTKAEKAKNEALIVQLEEAGYIIYGIIEPYEIEEEIDSYNDGNDCHINLDTYQEQRMIELIRHQMTINPPHNTRRVIENVLDEIIDPREHPKYYRNTDMYYEERRGG